MATTLYLFALVFVAFVSLVAVLSKNFKDNLLQRIGLSMACLGAVARIMEFSDPLQDESSARYLFTYGVAVFALGALFKFRRPK